MPLRDFAGTASSGTVESKDFAGLQPFVVEAADIADVDIASKRDGKEWLQEVLLLGMSMSGDLFDFRLSLFAGRE